MQILLFSPVFQYWNDFFINDGITIGNKNSEKYSASWSKKDNKKM